MRRMWANLWTSIKLSSSHPTNSIAKLSSAKSRHEIMALKVKMTMRTSNVTLSRRGKQFIRTRRCSKRIFNLKIKMEQLLLKMAIIIRASRSQNLGLWANQIGISKRNRPLKYPNTIQNTCLWPKRTSSTFQPKSTPRMLDWGKWNCQKK